MASLFAITTPASSVMLDMAHRGQASFTVTNTSGRPVRGRARLALQNPAFASWITLIEPVERDFPVGGTQQYTVTVAVPPKTPSGNYFFRFDMVGVENPDEYYTQGPSVAFQVAVVQTPKFPWWIVAAAVAVLVLVAGVILALVLTRKNTVPDVTGLSLSEAQTELQKVGFGFGETKLEPSGVIPVGMITHTDPGAGDQAGQGAKINIFVSSGPAAQQSTPTFTPTVFTPSDTPSPTFTLHPTITLTGTEPPTLTFTPTSTETPTNTPEPSSMIARYPLASDANDTTGLNGPMTLANAPFSDGGVYCNGVYQNCNVSTPPINGFNYNSFSISIHFKPDAVSRMPVFVGGGSYRWIGYYLLENGNVALLYNNSNYVDCGVPYQAGKWYNGTISYDGTTAKLYLGNKLACTQALTLVTGGDKDISLTNYSSGQTFKGVVNYLVVNNVPITPGFIILKTLVVPIDPGFFLSTP